MWKTLLVSKELRGFLPNKQAESGRRGYEPTVAQISNLVPTDFRAALAQPSLVQVPSMTDTRTACQRVYQYQLVHQDLVQAIVNGQASMSTCGTGPVHISWNINMQKQLHKLEVHKPNACLQF